jgi:hypothetical protein
VAFWQVVFHYGALPPMSAQADREQRPFFVVDPLFRISLELDGLAFGVKVPKPCNFYQNRLDHPNGH